MIRSLWTLFFLFSCHTVFGQISDIVKPDAISSPFHRANIGKITFMAKPIPLEDSKESDFLKQFELRDSVDLNIRAFMDNSLTNYLHRLAPDLTADELVKVGNYQLSFAVDGLLVYTETLNPGAGSRESKNARTTFRVPFLTTTDEDSWGTFMWDRFMVRGGQEALTSGAHSLKIELRPYIKNPDVKTGELIAEGQIQLNVIKRAIDERQVAVQPIAPNSGWEISTASYDTKKIQTLNRNIADKTYKDITSIVVIKDGKLLIEEYFNGTARDSLHNTRSATKSFTSTMMGIAIHEGFILNEDQTLKSLYDLKQFKNHSQKKEGVSIKSLLTMSSAFGGDDNDDNSPGNEELMYPTDNWVKFALDLPMDSNREIGKVWTYFTAGVVLLGDIINKSVPGGMDQYADKKLFTPLGITKYRWGYTPQHVPNTAGGLLLRSLDLAKFGQLYKNGGSWNGQELLPRDWVNKTFAKYLKIPFDSSGYYGFLFWNTTLHVKEKNYEAWYATGNGGNKVFIFKDQPLVVVITATAYNKGYAHPQSQKIMEKYLLPAISE